MLQKAIFATEMKSKIYHQSTKLGIALSFLCAIHCILMPILLIIFPFLGESMLHDPVLEWVLLFSLIFLGFFSLDHYKRKHHGSNLPSVVFGLGATISFIALAFHSEFHHALMIVGALVIASSQIMNITLKRAIN